MKNVFTADLRGLDLSSDQISRIEAGIQDVVLRELGNAPRPSTKERMIKNYVIHIPKEWIGIWINTHDFDLKVPKFNELIK